MKTISNGPAASQLGTAQKLTLEPGGTLPSMSMSMSVTPSARLRGDHRATGAAHHVVLRVEGGDHAAGELWRLLCDAGDDEAIDTLTGLLARGPAGPRRSCQS